MSAILPQMDQARNEHELIELGFRDLETAAMVLSLVSPVTSIIVP